MRILIAMLFLFLCILPVCAVEEEVIELPIDTEKRDVQDSFSKKFKLQIENSPYLTGDWAGHRSKLEDKGVDIQSSYIINSMVMRNGSAKSARTTYQGVYNLSLELDSEKMRAYKGGKLFVLYQAANKGLSSVDYLNSYSFVNSFDPTARLNQIGELYYEHSFKDDLLNIKIGKQDANIDFQALDTGFNFMNLSFSFIPNTPLPFFPVQQTGARIRAKINDKLYIQNGIYDGGLDVASNPKGFFNGKNGYFDIAEVYYLSDFRGLKGKYLLGSWFKTGDFERIDTSDTKKNNFGSYFGFEQKLYNSKENENGGLSAFGQFGYADEKINGVPYYFGSGLCWKGVGKRKDDAIGLGLAWHQFSKTLKDIENMTSEKVIEIFYKLKLTNSIYIQPDFQYIVRPGGNQADSFVIGLRSFIAL